MERVTVFGFNRGTYNLLRSHHLEREKNGLFLEDKNRAAKTGVRASVTLAAYFWGSCLWPFPELLLRWSHREVVGHCFTHCPMGVWPSNKSAKRSWKPQTWQMYHTVSRTQRKEDPGNLEPWWFLLRLYRTGQTHVLWVSSPVPPAYLPSPFCLTSLFFSGMAGKFHAGKVDTLQVTYLVHLGCHFSMKLLFILSNDCNRPFSWSLKVIKIATCP